MNKYDVQEFDTYMKIFTAWFIKRIINTVTDNKPREFKHIPSKYRTITGVDYGKKEK